MPASTLSKTEAADLSQPRAGSRRAVPAAPKAGSGVVPASLDAPLPAPRR
jgi:hypothetical protein